MTAVAAATRRHVPGWPEILAATVVYLVTFGLVVWLLPLVTDEALAGVVGLLVSGAMGIAAFLVACAIRARRLEPFGLRAAKPRHLLAGAGLGVVAYVVGVILSVGYITLTGDDQNVQTSYQAAAGGGWPFLVLALVAGSIVTPIGEELAFRGVLANALLARWPAWLAIVVSAAIFAVAHGINPVMGGAFVVGVLAGVLLRWSGSIWPGVVLHGVNNAVALLVPVLVAAALG